MEPTPLPPPMPRPNWFGRNWKWVVPLGCLLPVLFAGGCGLLAFLFATGIMKQSDAYKIALARAQANPAVIEAIGSPISQTGIVSGNSNVSGANRPSEPIDPAEWPKRESYALCRSEEIGGHWVFQTMVVKIEKTGERIDLNTVTGTCQSCITATRLEIGESCTPASLLGRRFGETSKPARETRRSQSARGACFKPILLAETGRHATIVFA